MDLFPSHHLVFCYSSVSFHFTCSPTGQNKPRCALIVSDSNNNSSHVSYSVCSGSSPTTNPVFVYWSSLDQVLVLAVTLVDAPVRTCTMSPSLLSTAHKGFQRFDALETSDWSGPSKTRTGLAPRQRFLFISVQDKKVNGAQAFATSTHFLTSDPVALVCPGASVQLQLVPGPGLGSEPGPGPPGEVAERQSSCGSLSAEPEDGPVPPPLLL